MSVAGVYVPVQLSLQGCVLNSTSKSMSRGCIQVLIPLHQQIVVDYEWVVIHYWWVVIAVYMDCLVDGYMGE